MALIGAPAEFRLVDYDASYPPSLWAPPVTPSTTGVAGELGVSDGTWLPPGSTPPNSQDLVAGIPVAVTAQPSTAWTGSQVIICADDKAASWTGTAWVALPSLLAAATPAEDPGSYLVAEVQAWVTEHPEDLDQALAAEQARGGAARSTLVAWLQARQEAT